MLAALISAIALMRAAIFLDDTAKLRPAMLCLDTQSINFVPTLAFAHNKNISHSILPEQPYTSIYTETMVLSGLHGEGITLNHPDAPLQCNLTFVPVEDTSWTAESALSVLLDAAISASWTETFPGFVLGAKSTTPFQTKTAISL